MFSETLKTMSSQEGVGSPEEYGSKVTEEYFSDWDGLELQDFFNLKETLKNNIVEFESRGESKTAYEKWAKKNKITVEELKAKLQKKAEEAVEKSDFYRVTNTNTLEKVLEEDGRFKSQFETHRSGGCLNFSKRCALEYTFFGFPNEIGNEVSKRPIYGYLSDSPFGVVNEEGKVPPPDSSVFYGNIIVKMKRNRVIDRTTITFQDSLNCMTSHVPSPAKNPHFASFGNDRWGNDPLKTFSRTGVSSFSNYTEVQYHGGITTDDIDSICLVPGICRKDDDYIRRIRQLVEDYNKRNPQKPIKVIVQGESEETLPAMTISNI